MKPLTPSLTALVDWVQMTRTSAPLLGNEADSLLNELSKLSEHQRRITTLEDAPLTLGIYGHAQASKHYLLKTLQGNSAGRVDILLGDKRLDYLTHINPGHSSATIAVRFSAHRPPDVEHYPLLLTLLSEAELTRQFIHRYHAALDPRLALSSTMALRLSRLEAHRQPVPILGLTGEQVAGLLYDYQRLQRGQNPLDESLCHQIASLAPSLSLEDRASLFAPLWGEDRALTETWLHLAQALHHLGSVRQVLAPASLVVDNFLLPAEGFLLPSDSEALTDVMVCPLADNQPGLPLSLPLHDLTQLCAEIMFTTDHDAVLANVDLLDIPSHYLDEYTHRLQPDTLLICNAASARHEIQSTGKALARWVDCTQGSGGGALPGLVWAITPFDARFTHENHFDDSIQRLVGQPGKRWGTLQALDSRNMHRLLEWLTDALNLGRRERRVAGLQSDLNSRLSALFRHFVEPRQVTSQQTEEWIRALQASAAHHGNLLASLIPSRDAFQQCWYQYQQQNRPKPEGFALEIDLFADTTSVPAQAGSRFSYAHAAHRLWVNHLRQFGRREAAQRFGLDDITLQALCEVLIITSYRLDIPAQLEHGLQSDTPGLELEISRVMTLLGDFIAWLGYADLPVSDRPASRINKGQAIFAPPVQADISRRLTTLGEQPTHGNANYVYDWLVALYTRAIENRTYHHPEDISDKQREILLTLLS